MPLIRFILSDAVIDIDRARRWQHIVLSSKIYHKCQSDCLMARVCSTVPRIENENKSIFVRAFATVTQQLKWSVNVVLSTNMKMTFNAAWDVK